MIDKKYKSAHFFGHFELFYLINEFLQLFVAKNSSIFFKDVSIISIKALSVDEATCGVTKTRGYKSISF